MLVPAACGGDAGVPMTDAGSVDAGAGDDGGDCTPVAIPCDDLTVAMTGIDPGSFTVTRLRADLPSSALAADLVLEASPSQDSAPSFHATQRYTVANYDAEAGHALRRCDRAAPRLGGPRLRRASPATGLRPFWYRAGVLIVGDIGGTNARLHLLSPRGRLERHQVFASHDYPSLEAAVRAFLGPKPPRITAAVFGVAGPVVDNRCVGTNLPWVIDGRVVSRKLGVRKVTLLNDLVALSLGAVAVRPSKRVVLGTAGAPKKKGNLAVIAAGTGLGEAILVWDGERHVPSATEGGHADFAPRDEVEMDVLRFLTARYRGHVSFERLVSGMGMGNLYDFFRDGIGTRAGLGEAPALADEIAKAPDRNAAIARLGAEGKSAPAKAAVERFASIYGAEAGNLALKSMSVGGVLVCGNIASKMLPVLERGGFMKAFADKGRFRGMLEKVPVAVVTDSDVGLQGSTRVALGEV
jgi:glucokinase